LCEGSNDPDASERSESSELFTCAAGARRRAVQRVQPMKGRMLSLRELRARGSPRDCISRYTPHRISGCRWVNGSIVAEKLLVSAQSGNRVCGIAANSTASSRQYKRNNRNIARKQVRAIADRAEGDAP
jgi:hypothetical protein